MLQDKSETVLLAYLHPTLAKNADEPFTSILNYLPCARFFGEYQPLSDHVGRIQQTDNKHLIHVTATEVINLRTAEDLIQGLT